MQRPMTPGADSSCTTHVRPDNALEGAEYFCKVPIIACWPPPSITFHSELFWISAIARNILHILYLKYRRMSTTLGRAFWWSGSRPTRFGLESISGLALASMARCSLFSEVNLSFSFKELVSKMREPCSRSYPILKSDSCMGCITVSPLSTE